MRIRGIACDRCRKVIVTTAKDQLSEPYYRLNVVGSKRYLICCDCVRLFADFMGETEGVAESREKVKS